MHQLSFPSLPQVCFCSGSNVTIRSCQSSLRQVTWKAHEGVVLKVDWSPINHMVVTGGEDCKYKVGRMDNKRE